ncbi:MAG: hypothetical protein GY711_05920 [bacterium]|nr:hypothetical protein [bacterium]
MRALPATDRVTGRTLAALLFVALLSAGVRVANGLRIPLVPAAPGERVTDWFSTDPDSLYHMRRLRRALDDGGAVAARDPLLAPAQYADVGGAPIPWPPYYTRVLHAVSVAFAPDGEPGRSRFVERFVASAPALLGVMTTILIALAAARCAPRGHATLAALGAGTYHALLFGSLRYTYLGMGDHHAWITLLSAALFCVVGGTRGAVRGALAGALCGLMVGSWVAAVMYVVIVQLVLGVRILMCAVGERVELARFGVALHAVAAAVLSPAVLASPFGAYEVVNLSWFHVAHLVLGGLVFVPLLVMTGPVERARRAACALALAAAALLLVPAWAGIRESFAWASATNDFMSFINESQPLLGGTTQGWRTFFLYLGLGAPFALVAWGPALLHALRRDPRVLVWAVSFPLLFALAISQKRFADAAGVPLVFLLAWGAVRVLAPLAARGRTWAVGVAAGACVLAAGANPDPLRTSRARVALDTAFVETNVGRGQRVLRASLAKLREDPEDRRRPDPRPRGRAAGAAVLAQWDLGHVIEWVAERPTVASNFGSYLGDESYRTPWRFFLAETESGAEELLVEASAGWVIVTADFARNAATMSHVVGGVEDDLRGTIATELVPLGTRRRGSLGFLRRVYGELIPGRPASRGASAVYEHVAGARLEWSAAPGAVVRAELELRGPGPLIQVWTGRAEADEAGRARLRVPYATNSKRGDVETVGSLRWSIGRERGTAEIPEDAVRRGATISVE